MNTLAAKGNAGIDRLTCKSDLQVWLLFVIVEYAAKNSGELGN